MPKTTKRISWTGVFITSLFFLGCDESLPPGMPTLHPIELIFTQSGKPLNGAAVQLIPLDSASKWVTGGGTDAVGSVTLQTHGTYSGVPAGKYKVCVTKTETEGKLGEVDMSNPSQSSDSTLKTISLVDEQYRLPMTTPLEIEVTGSNDQFSAFELGAPVRTAQARPPM